MSEGFQEVLELTPEQLKQRLDTGEPLHLIDVREPYEWSISNLEPQGARLIPLGDLAARMDELDRGIDLVLYCRSGKRSEGAARQLRANGFDRVWSLQGGINAWSSVIDPNLPTY